jgi:hypothetical protein
VLRIGSNPANPPNFKKKGKIMAIDLTQFKDKYETPEIRVWCHPKSGGDGYCYKFLTIKKAWDFIEQEKKSKKHHVEDCPLIAFAGLELTIADFRKKFPKVEI